MDKYYSNNEFDISKFNSAFEDKQDFKENDKELDTMKKVIEKEQLHDMSLGKILVNMKDEIFGILYDIITINFNSSDTFIEIFTKNNRLFYIGLFLIIICIFLYIISYLFYYPKPEHNIVKNNPIPKQNVSNKNNNLLKTKLFNNSKKIDMMYNEIINLKKQISTGDNQPLNDDYEYELDDQDVDSDIIPKEIKEQIKNQIKQDLLNSKN